MEAKTKRSPTSADVARAAGVSRATVSLVLNEVPDSRIPAATRDRVLAAVAELGYAPNAQARQLRAGMSRLILMPLPRFPLGPAMDRVIERLSTQLQSRGFTLLLHADRDASGMPGARLWAEQRPAAVLVSADRCTKASVALLRSAGTHVLLTAEQPSPLAETLIVDQRQIGAAAAGHLCATGHRRLAALVPAGDLEPLARRRFEGMQEVAAAAGAQVEAVLVEQTPEGAAQVADALTRPGGPTAVFTYNDEYGALLHSVLSDRGLSFPGDMALVGADDLPVARYLRPALSSVTIDAEGLADRFLLATLTLLGIPAAASPADPHLLSRPSVVRRGTS
ncbi:LacI family DNA-binding transcriptional regulator [Streptomyces sp. NPDC005803]|uniref:LacI family DNA-binding transcriptional regulator n=1 Tax=Streptomyces sp. NPDC005803 TaxID=3154297 RepID=UPI003410914D